jgi:hypothetical protein
MTHRCPGPGCEAEVDPSMLMCPGCWYQVSKPVRRAVHIAWNRGAGPAPRPTGPLSVSRWQRSAARSSPHHPSSTRPAALP